MADKENPQSSDPTPRAPRAPRPKPTEQLPLESAPVSASAAASGGATGLTHEDAERPSVFRRHPLATGITAGALAVVLVSGLTAWGVGSAVTASLTSSTTNEAPMSAPTATPAPGRMATAGQVAFRATIQSIDGNSWSILTKKGKTVTVGIDSATRFGTKKTSETSGSFAVGDSVVIIAMRGTDGTPTATRVALASAVGAGKGSGASNTMPSPMPTPMPSMTPDPNA